MCGGKKNAVRRVRQASQLVEELGLIGFDEEHEPLAFDFSSGAGAFAIDGQGGDVPVLEVGAQPIVDQAIQFNGVQALEDSAEGRFTSPKTSELGIVMGGMHL